MLSQDFHDFARLSELKKQRLTHQGVVVLQEQEGQYGEPGYVPSDLTVGLISPVVIYPDEKENTDIPGRTGGPALNFDNSLTREGSVEYISAPMEVEVIAPDHTVTNPIVTQINFEKLRNSLQGETGTVTIEFTHRQSDNYDNEHIDATFEYHDGTTWQTVDSDDVTQRWDLFSVYSFDITLPSASSGTFQIRTTFANGNSVGGYEVYATLVADGVERFTASDLFDLS